MRTQKVIMLIVLVVMLVGAAVVVGVIWWLGAGLGSMVVVGALAVSAVAFFVVVRPWYLHWGATNEEASMPMPGDELIPDTKAAIRAITIAAQPADVWPWLVQLGFGRPVGTATTGSTTMAGQAPTRSCRSCRTSRSETRS